jgi:hypothetical protein
VCGWGGCFATPRPEVEFKLIGPGRRLEVEFKNLWGPEVEFKFMGADRRLRLNIYGGPAEF